MAKWNDEEIDLLKKLYDENLGNKEIADQLGKTPKAVRLFLNRKLGLNFSDQDKGLTEQIQCLNCQTELAVLKSENRRFCGQSCSVKYNNSRRVVTRHKQDYGTFEVGDEVSRKTLCLMCEKKTSNPKYCCFECSILHVEKIGFQKLQNGSLLCPQTIKRYLYKKHGMKCMECGWAELNPTTNKVPLEMHHVDGNSDNNKESNLIILCPNHHALQPYHKGSVKGGGRHARRKKAYDEGRAR